MLIQMLLRNTHEKRSTNSILLLYEQQKLLLVLCTSIRLLAGLRGSFRKRQSELSTYIQ